MPMATPVSHSQGIFPSNAGQWSTDLQADAAAQRHRGLDPRAEDRLEALSAQVVTGFSAPVTNITAPFNPSQEVSR